jgi:hypothetical protein
LLLLLSSTVLLSSFVVLKKAALLKKFAYVLMMLLAARVSAALVHFLCAVFLLVPEMLLLELDQQTVLLHCKLVEQHLVEGLALNLRSK